jgi:SAM-dependent methyltransferase
VRRPEPRIAAQLEAALGDARTVINVGAGTGSYEPTDRHVVAVEPAAEMRVRRDPTLAPAIDARAEALPFDDGAFDAALAVLTVHHWPDLEAGLAELRRVARQRLVIMTADPAALADIWVADYAPEFHRAECRRYPSIDRIAAALGVELESRPLIVPFDCSDGFTDAFYGRPEAMLDPAVRRAQSAWSFVGQADQDQFVERLSADLESGRRDERHGHLRTQPELESSMRILVAHTASS